MDEVFPANIFYNMVFAAQSWNRSVEYPQRSQDFDFQARATHPDTLREVYVLVIGETAGRLTSDCTAIRAIRRPAWKKYPASSLSRMRSPSPTPRTRVSR